MRHKRLLLIAACVATVVASFSSSFLAIDGRVIGWLRENRAGRFIDAALIVTALGSTPVALGILAITALWLAIRRWWRDLRVPSGHAMTATVLFGGLVVIFLDHESRPANRARAIGAAAGLIALVAGTRVYLGAHFFTDVLGGVAFGLLWVTMCDALVRRSFRSAHD